MGHVLELRPSAAAANHHLQPDLSSPSIRTSEVYVAFTSIDETLAAVRIGSELAEALAVPLTLVHFRAVPYAVPVDHPVGLSPVETEGFLDQLTSQQFDIRLRVYLCRSLRRAIPLAFRRHSLVVVGGRRRWWPRRSSRLRQALEAAGHFVVFVDEGRHAA